MTVALMTAATEKIERRTRLAMSTTAFWLIVAYFILAAVTFGLFVALHDSSKAQARTARDEAVHQAEITSAARAAVSQCLASRPVLFRINGFLTAEKDIAETLVANSLRTVRQTPMSSAMYDLRVSNYLRLRSRLQAIESVRFPVPTVAACKSRGSRVLHSG
jgi:hypothetical protein